ncbi:MAG: helix-turn-helix domain-containing protein [Microthrixaceae bacterium]
MAITIEELEGVVLPPWDLTTTRQLDQLLHESDAAVLRDPDGREVPIPPEVYQVLLTVADAMSRGQAIAVLPRNQRLTTSEAAEFIGVSRPTLIRILDEGRLAYERPNRHRRILLTDLIDFMEQRRMVRRELLSEMTDDAAEAGLYETVPSAEELREVSKRARKAATRHNT